MSAGTALTIRTAEAPGDPNKPSEDRIFTTDSAVILLDGATDREQRVYTGGWIAEQAGSRIQAALTDEPAIENFDYRIGLGDTDAIDVNPLDGITTLSVDWEDWRTGGRGFLDGDGFYDGTGVGSWQNWEERMWFLINLFRITLTDGTLLSSFDSASHALGGNDVRLGVSANGGDCCSGCVSEGWS